MKRLFIYLVLSLLLINTTYAGFLGKIKLTWNSNPPSQVVTKYVIYQVISVTNYIPTVTAYNTNVANVNVTTPGTYTYAIAAFNIVGQSGFSSTVTTNVMPASIPTIPGGIQIISVIVTNTP